MDEFGPLNIMPLPGHHWAAGTRLLRRAGTKRRRRRATYHRSEGVRHLFGALDLQRDKLYGHIKAGKRRGELLSFCKYLRSLYPPGLRIGLVLGNFSPHLSTRKDSRVGEWAAANNVELPYVPTDASWLNRIECHFAALRYFALDGTDHKDHFEQGDMVRRYIAWRNRHANDEALRVISKRAKVA